MSLGDLRACSRGLSRTGGGSCFMIPEAHNVDNNLNTGDMEVDNRCCFCLKLREGVIIIGASNFLFYLLALAWYIGKVGFTSDFELQISNIDISIFVLILIQLIVNLLLIVAAAKRLPHHTFPWICSNGVVIALILVMIFMLVFLGASRNDLTYMEYVGALTFLSVLAGTLMFCCIVVFQFRSNLLIELRSPSSHRSSGNNLNLPMTAPPPSYEDAAPKSPMMKNTCLYADAPPGYEDSLPGYDDAMAMLRPCAPPLDSSTSPLDPSSSPGPHLRKKSLTPHVV